MNKENLKKVLLAMHENTVSELQEKVDTTHSIVDIDEDDTHDPDDYSHQYESGELEQLMRTQLNKAKKSLDFLKTIDFSEKTSAEMGAYVETNKFNFFVGFASVPFDVEGKHIIGVSANSPIYTVMLGKKEGDDFSYNGVNYEIISIN